MSKNPKKKKNLVHAPPAWAIVNCPNSWIARTRRPARINFALTKFANVTGMFREAIARSAEAKPASVIFCFSSLDQLSGKCRKSRKRVLERHCSVLGMVKMVFGVLNVIWEKAMWYFYFSPGLSKSTKRDHLDSCLKLLYFLFELYLTKQPLPPPN